MSDYLFLVPISLLLGLVGLLAFLWALRSDQYNDLEGAAARVLEEDDRPIVDRACADQPEVEVTALHETADRIKSADPAG